jgi:hypothetical protein
MSVDALFTEADIDLERVMHEWAQVDAQSREAYTRKRELGAELAAFAEDKRETQNTVHLSAHDGLSLKVEFKHETIYDPAQMQAVAELLGDKFDELFKTEIKFVPQRRNLTKFLNTVSTSEAVETAKGLIKEAATDKQLSPYISLEKGSTK